MQYSFRHKTKKNKGQHDHKDLYGSSQAVDITEGKSYNDARVVQFAREIKQLKEKIELQTEYTRKLEQEKTELTAKLESYKRRCSDLQKNLDDKDQHLNEVLSTAVAEHSVTYNIKSLVSSGCLSPLSTIFHFIAFLHFQCPSCH